MFTVYQVQMALINFPPAYRVVVSYYSFADRELVTTASTSTAQSPATFFQCASGVMIPIRVVRCNWNPYRQSKDLFQNQDARAQQTKESCLR